MRNKESIPAKPLEPPLLVETAETKGIEIVKHDEKSKIPSLPPTDDEPLPKYQSSSSSSAPVANPSPSKPADDEDDFDALTRRFAALKKRT